MRTDRPRPYPVYVRREPRTWWLRSPGFRRFAAREITSVFAAGFSVVLLLFLWALSRGREAYEGFLRWLDHPATVALFAVILAAMLYHAGTWFRLTAHVQVVRLGRWEVPRQAVTATLFVVWIGASALIAYIHIWF